LRLATFPQNACKSTKKVSIPNHRPSIIFRNPLVVLEFFSYICTLKGQYYSFMLDRAQTIEKLKTTRQYLDEHYGVHSMTLFGSLARNEQREDSDVDICVEMVPDVSES
jgi:hypothetical protein